MQDLSAPAPMPRDTQTVSRFRRRRGARLRRLIDAVSDRLGRDLTILDVGGRSLYWNNVGLERVRSVIVQNFNERELEISKRRAPTPNRFTYVVGDGRDLRDFGDASVDLVHANSVIEHVGAWPDMKALADEVQRVGRAGWIQTPAWEFPIEPHYRLPAVHWLGEPVRTTALRLTPKYRRCSLAERRTAVDGVNLLAFSEFLYLFPGKSVYIERFMLLPKSYTAYWMT